MRLRSLCFALLFAALPTVAQAEMAHTSKQLTLRAKPSSSGKSLDKVPADTDLAVLERSPDGKWIKVLFGESEGWLAVKDLSITADPAPTADEGTPPPEAEKPAAPEGGGKGKVRPEVWVEDSRYHAGGAPAAVVVTAARADLIDRPREGAAKVGEVKQGQKLAISRASRDNAFFLVELEGGRTAWIAASSVAATKAEPVTARPLPPDKSAAAAEVVPASAPTVEPAKAVEARTAEASAVARRVAQRRFHVRAEAAFALGRIDQTFHSNATGPLTNYGDHTGLLGADLALQLDGNGGGPWFGGVLLGYRFGGGADITAQLDGRAVTLGLRAHDLEGLGLFGYRTEALGGLALFARAGARLTLALIDQDYAVALPSERLLGLQVGLGIEVPRLLGGLGASAAIDWIPLGSRDQTEHLGEGQDAGTSGYSASVALHYAFTDAVSIHVGGRFLHAATHFDGVADRNPAIRTADRTTELAAIDLGLRLTH